jgi:hypothetical protein
MRDQHRFLMDPGHWRDRADETLAKATEMFQPETRDRLLRVAREYEALADRAERYLHEQGASQAAGAPAGDRGGKP